MKRLTLILFFISGAAIYGNTSADSTRANSRDSNYVKSDSLNIARPGVRFVDKNGDGFNDLAPDHDGDGIPNGLDKDWRKMQGNKRGYRHRHRHGWRIELPDSTKSDDSTSLNKRRNIK